LIVESLGTDLELVKHIDEANLIARFDPDLGPQFITDGNTALAIQVTGHGLTNDQAL